MPRPQNKRAKLTPPPGGMGRTSAKSKGRVMNKFIFIFLLCVSNVALSAAGVVKGKVQYIRTHNSELWAGSEWAPPRFWFTLEGGSSAGSCLKYNGENIMFVMDNDQAYSMIMAAFMAGKEISVVWDDQLRSGTNHCFAKYVTVGNPPPNTYDG